MISPDTIKAAAIAAPVAVVLEQFVDRALEMSPRLAVRRLCEPKDHMPLEVAEYIDDLMRWVILLDRERSVPAG